MPREKHGHYNENRRLPDNSMQPIGSGINVWLQEQLLSVLGEQEGQALIAEATPHKTKRYEWLCERLIERGHAAIVKEYREKQKENAAERRTRDKRRELGLWKDRLAETTIEDQKVWYLKQIAKCEKYLRERS